MSLSKMSDAELVTFRDSLQEFHTGIGGNIIRLTYEDEYDEKQVCIEDKRLNDLIFTLFVEAHNELCERFKHKLKWNRRQQQKHPFQQVT